MQCVDLCLFVPTNNLARLQSSSKLERQRSQPVRRHCLRLSVDGALSPFCPSTEAHMSVRRLLHLKNNTDHGRRRPPHRRYTIVLLLYQHHVAKSPYLFLLYPYPIVFIVDHHFVGNFHC